METVKTCQHQLDIGIKSVPVEVRESFIPSVAQELKQSILDDMYFTFNDQGE